MTSPLATKLLDWYAVHARTLPWRGQVDAYATWVSEIMLQQTRVETVIPYLERWMAHFPTISDLAAASQGQVLGLWEGLGYYSRARNLHRAAQIVMQEYAGGLPRDPKKLRKLPGIGRYTAAAIASIAFNADEPALDGNIRRVLARLFDVTHPIRNAAGERYFWDLAAAQLPPGRAGDYNQALMDLGATLCTPLAPACERCPLAELCQARAKGVQAQRPVQLPKPTTPHYTVAAAIIHRNGSILIAQRPARGLLGGLWEFPGGKTEKGETLEACLQREICEELGIAIEVGEPFGIYKHAFTHFKVTLHAFHCNLPQGEPVAREHSDLCWVKPAEMSAFPMGKIDRQIARSLNQ